MYVVLVQVKVRPESLGEFERLLMHTLGKDPQAEESLP